MKKHNLFNELMQGLDDLEAERTGKKTLRTHEVQAQPEVQIQAAEIVSLRDSLGLSRAVFARYLRTNPRTLENWEQGRAKPNAQAALILRMVEKFPDTMQRLAVV